MTGHDNRRHWRMALAVVVACLTTAPATSAGTYQVTACDARPAVGPEHAWKASISSGAPLETSAACPTARTAYSGLSARDVDGAALDSRGQARAEWSFTAPPSTTIAALTATRFLGIYGTDSFHAYLRDGTGSYLEACTPDQDPGFGCTLGTSTGAAGAVRSFTGLSTNRLAYGVFCSSPSNGICANGATRNRAWATLYGATVTLTDAVPPQILATAGDLFSGASTWRTGTASGSVTASDAGGGVGRVELLVDGALIPGSVSDVPCDYTVPAPCPTGPEARAVALATASLGDGTHTVQARVTDATRDRDDANRTVTAAVSLRVDNTPPETAAIAPVPSVGVGEPFGVSWTAPVQGVGSPIVDARWELVSPVGAVHASGVTTGTAVSGLAVPVDGTWSVRVTLRDAAGEGAPAIRTFTTELPESPAAPPVPMPESTTTAPGPPTLPSAPLSPARAPATVPHPVTAAQRSARLADLRAVRRRAAVRVSGRALVAGRVRISAAGRVVAVVRVRVGRPFDVSVSVPQRTTRVVVRHRTAAGHAGRAVIVRVR